MLHLEIVKSVYFTEKLYKTLLGAIVLYVRLEQNKLKLFKSITAIRHRSAMMFLSSHFSSWVHSLGYQEMENDRWV